jgi:serine protease Do
VGQATAPAPPAPALNLLQQIEEGVAALAREINPCVVTIEGSTEQAIVPGRPVIPPTKGENTSSSNTRANEETIAQLLTSNNRPSVTGSGFLIPGGFVVTTADVTSKMQDPMVIFPNGQKVKPLWINMDRLSNVAILKLPGIPAEKGLRWGDSDRIQQGNFAITFGNQGGFANSISLGLIAGKERAGRSGNVRYQDLIQFQGTVGKGSSGGPLINSRGEVIGMIVATPSLSMGLSGGMLFQRADSGGGTNGENPLRSLPALISLSFSNIGFAVPTNAIVGVVKTLCERKTPASRLGWLGIALPEEEDANPDLEGVYEKGPADKAGLRPSDRILAVNGQTVKNNAALRLLIRKLVAGEELRLLIRRKKSEMTVLVTVEPRPSEAEIGKTKVKSDPDAE